MSCTAFIQLSWDYHFCSEWLQNSSYPDRWHPILTRWLTCFVPGLYTYALSSSRAGPLGGLCTSHKGKRSSGKSGGLDSRPTMTPWKLFTIPGLQFPLLEQGRVDSDDLQSPFLFWHSVALHLAYRTVLCLKKGFCPLSHSYAPNISGPNLYTIRSQWHLLLIWWLKIFSSLVFEILSLSRYDNLDIAGFVLHYNKHIILARPREMIDLQWPCGWQQTAQVSHLHSVPEKGICLIQLDVQP